MCRSGEVGEGVGVSMSVSGTLGLAIGMKDRGAAGFSRTLGRLHRSDCARALELVDMGQGLVLLDVVQGAVARGRGVLERDHELEDVGERD